MKTRTIIFAVFLTVLAVSCSKQQSGSAPSGLQDMVFNAGYCVDGSKTVLSGQDVLWQAGDEICIFDHENATDGNKFTTSGSGVTALFKGKAAQSDVYYAVYPYEAAVRCFGFSTTRNVDVVIPVIQAIPEGGFAEGANVSVGRTSDQLLYMYNVCGYVKFSLSESKYTKVLLESVGGEPLAGKSRNTFYQNDKWSGSSVKTDDTDFPPSSSIEILPVSSETFAPGSYYACVAKCESLTGGIRFTLFDNENKIWEKTIPHLDRIKRAEPVNVGIADIGTTRVVKTLALDSSTKTNITPGENTATIYLDTDCTDVTAQVKDGATLADVSVSKVSNTEFTVTFTPNSSDDPVDLKTATIEFTAFGADPLDVTLNQGGVVVLDFLGSKSKYGLVNKQAFASFNLVTTYGSTYTFTNVDGPSANVWRTDNGGGFAYKPDGAFIFPGIANQTLRSVRIEIKGSANLTKGLVLGIKNTEDVDMCNTQATTSTTDTSFSETKIFELESPVRGECYKLVGTGNNKLTYIAHIYLYYDYDPEPTNE